ncbi:MAG: class I SAM-dependent methyltransferase [Opitutaceae bacterium]|nr:class I SAM-dependent methyltransferase [Opitutaceae bacterium]
MPVHIQVDPSFERHPLWEMISAELNDEKGRYCLRFEKGIVELVDQDDLTLNPLSVDFKSGTLGYRVKYGGGASQPIAKACGLNKRKGLTLIDATCGLGRDAFVLASVGAKVIAYERHPVIYCLVKDALMRWEATEVHLTIEFQNSVTALNQLGEGAVDVVYLDPMFPKRDKSSLVKKEMQMFHGLIGNEAMDVNELLEAAMRVASKRVVVKRPKSAPFLNDLEPSLSQKGKSGRFDIYTKAAIK